MSASDAKRVSFSGADGSNKQAGGALSHVSANEGGRKMGVLYTGYLEKKKVEWISVSFKRRFVVLTNEALHWFKRPDGYDLFGDERGRLSLINILSARVLTDDLSKFELVSTDNIERVFNAPSPDIAEEWVSAVRSALRNSKKITKRLRRRLSEMHGPLDITAGGMDEDEVNVALLSLFSSATGMEWVVTRKPAWGRVVSLRQCHDEDEVLIALNTGGHVRSTCKELRAMALEAQEARVEAAAADACDSGDPGSTGGSSNSTSQNNNNNNNSSSSTAGAAGQPRRHSSVVSSTSTRRLSAQSLRGDGLEEIDGATDLPVEGVPIAATIRLAVSLPPRADSDLSGRNPPTYLEFLLAQLFMDKDSLLVVLLSVLTAAVCLCSLTDILRGKVSKQELMSYPSMLYGISAVLSIASARVTVKKLGSPKAIRQKKDETFSLNIILYGHAFARADTVGEEALPERFVNGCDGDQKEARRRWNQTKRWREEAGADDIIFEYQEHFSVMKNLYPHYHAGRSKWGHPVYYERAGDIQLDQLKVRGVGIDDMIHHWLFVSEWTWRVMAQVFLYPFLMIICFIYNMAIWHTPSLTHFLNRS
jgi:hypothetical protein